MSLLPFLVVTAGGAVLVLLLRRVERLASAVGIVALLAAVVAATRIRPDEVLAVGGDGLATTAFLGLFLLLGAACGAVLAIVGAATDTRRDASAVTLGLLATSGLALALPDARLAVLAATAGGVAGALLAIGPASGRAGATVGIRVLRATAVAGTMGIAASAWIGRDLTELAAQPVVFGLAYLAMALAVAIRSGAIPFHAWAARLTDSVPEATLPLLTAWAPAAFAVVALAWADQSIAPLLVDVGPARPVVIAIALSSILLGTLAALIQDDIEHVVGYSIIGDAGVILLAVAVLDPAAWEPARTYVLVFVVARSAFAAWAAAARATFGTGRVAELRGWMLRSPALALAFAVIVVATIGLPGVAVYEARATVVGLALGGIVERVVLVGVLGPVLYYGRLVLVGVQRPRSGERGVVLGTRVSVTPVDLAALRPWLARTWDANRPVTATGGTLLLAVIALVLALGGLGGPAAAAGQPPSLEGATESFDPNQPPEPPASGDPGEPTVQPTVQPTLVPTDGPSFEPIPTP
ncbi:MAG: proton-conducting transporter membrane subunit [Candidatus Limnocylindria bacterium]